MQFRMLHLLTAFPSLVLATFLVMLPTQPVQASLTPILVKDFKSTPFLDELVSVNGTLFFRGSDGAHGNELWKSDGTASGTVMVKDILPGDKSSSPTHLTNVNGTLFFVATNGLTSDPGELWKSDGTTAGTVLVKDIKAGAGVSSSPNKLTAVNDLLFFTFSESLHGEELWKSDGTADGTVMVKDLNVGNSGSEPDNLTSMNGELFFQAHAGTNFALWKSDGTDSGTTEIKSYTSGFPYWLTNVNGILFYGKNDELWKSDGTSAGTVMVKNNVNPTALANVSSTLFFRGNDYTGHGEELWKSDGTAAGTILVKDINPGSYDSDPVGLMNVNGTLFFAADDGEHGLELWKSNGTDSGTVMIKDIVPGSSSSTPATRTISTVNGTFFFLASTGYGSDLWASDGSAAGTVQISHDLGVIDELTDVNGTLFFKAHSSGELWKLASPIAGYSSIPAPGSTINVGTAAVGSQVSTSLNISETGSTMLNIISHTLSGTNASDFDVSPANLSIPDGGTPQNLTIRCTPSAIGLRSAILTINHNAAGNPATYSLTCTGTQYFYAYLPLIRR